MYICVCRGINEKDLKEACARGLSARETMTKLRNEMGLGTACGICIEPSLEFLKQGSSLGRRAIEIAAASASPKS